MNRRSLAVFLAAALVAAIAGLLGHPRAHAQDLGLQGDPTRVTRAVFDPPKVAVGGTARLVIQIDVADGFHIYPQGADTPPPSFEWKLPKGWKAGKLEDLSKPKPFSWAHAPDEKEYALFGKVELAQHFEIAADAATGPAEVRATGAWTACDDSNCMPIDDVPVVAKADVVAAEAPAPNARDAPAPQPQAPAKPEPPPQPPKAADATPAEGSSWGHILGQAFFWGLLTVLTPCVFPLLPVTVSFSSKQPGPALPRAVAFAIGIVFTIAVVGLTFQTALDEMARGWWFNLAVGVIFLALALSLFGLFDLRLPGALTDWATQRSGAGGLVGTFFMAVTLALTSFSCSVAFLIGMYSQFDRGDKAQAIVGTVVYGSTLAAPFFLCTLFPAAIRSMPRSGAWMNAIKVTMGFVELALAFKFLRTVALNFGSDALPRSLVLAIWIACALGAAFYLFGWIVLPHDTKPESIGVFRLVFGVGFLTIALYLMPGLFGRGLSSQLEGFIQTQPWVDYTPAGVAAPDDGGGKVGAGGKPPATERWEWPRNDWDGALALAKSADKPVLLDFTGVG